MPIVDNAEFRAIMRDEFFPSWRALDGSPTADIRRYTRTGGNSVKKIPPVSTLVSGLTGLSVAQSQAGQYMLQSRDNLGLQLKEGDREFMFLDIPSAGGVAASTLLGTDEIVFEGGLWKPYEQTIQNDTAIGISSCWATRIGPSS